MLTWKVGEWAAYQEVDGQLYPVKILAIHSQPQQYPFPAYQVSLGTVPGAQYYGYLTRLPAFWTGPDTLLPLPEIWADPKNPRRLSQKLRRKIRKEKGIDPK